MEVSELFNIVHLSYESRYYEYNLKYLMWTDGGVGFHHLANKNSPIDNSSKDQYLIS